LKKKSHIEGAGNIVFQQKYIDGIEKIIKNSSEGYTKVFLTTDFKCMIMELNIR
tara:strand:- start:30 stop:191 length:162 start_codon:yes stop_codon:yes gene_type:complete